MPVSRRAIFRSGFKRSRKGNSWQRLPDGRTVTIFRAKQGGFSWCISDSDDPSFSGRFETEEAAMSDLCAALEYRDAI